MSRVGKKPITLPKGVKAEIQGQLIRVEGPKGKLSREVTIDIEMVLTNGELVFTRKNETQKVRALHGMERALVNNMIVGVSEGYKKQLNLLGVGYRADMKGKNLNLALGHSHDIDFPIPEGIQCSVVKENRDVFVVLEGADKCQVSQVAAKIRSLRPPEPYKGKGVRYHDEQVRRKAGKAGKK